MDKLKQWVALTLVAVVAIVAAGWFLLISPKRSEAAAVRTDAASVVAANQGLELQLATLKAQAKQLPAQQAKLAAVQAKIPDNPALPALIRALAQAADKAGVELVSLAPGTPALVVAPVAGTPVAAPAAGTAVTPVTAAPLGTAAGTLSSISVTVSVVGGYFQVEQFLDMIEGLTRAMKVTTFSLVPGTNPVKKVVGQALANASTLNATINGVVYLASGRLAIANKTTAGK
jgi:Tfp pilus assembly protein PilO